MEEAVNNSMVMLAVITGDGPDDVNAYFNRPFCVSEVRWRLVAGKHLQPVVHADDKTRIGEFVGTAPDDLKKIGGIDFVDLNTSDADYWKIGLKKMVEKAVDAGALPAPKGVAGSARWRRPSMRPAPKQRADDKTALVVHEAGAFTEA